MGVEERGSMQFVEKQTGLKEHASRLASEGNKKTGLLHTAERVLAEPVAVEPRRFSPAPMS
jgi:hypothetical protein